MTFNKDTSTVGAVTQWVKLVFLIVFGILLGMTLFVVLKDTRQSAIYREQQRIRTEVTNAKLQWAKYCRTGGDASVIDNLGGGVLGFLGSIVGGGSGEIDCQTLDTQAKQDPEQVVASLELLMKEAALSLNTFVESLSGKSWGFLFVIKDGASEVLERASFALDFLPFRLGPIARAIISGGRGDD
jgi:hypothetical protein